MVSIIENETGRGWQFSFIQEDTLRDLLGYKPKVKYDEYDLSDNPIDLSPFHNFFLAKDIAQGMISKVKRSRIIHNWTMIVDPR